MYIVLELFMLMWMLQKSTQKSHYDKDHLLGIPFFPAKYTTIGQLKITPRDKVKANGQHI